VAKGSSLNAVVWLSKKGNVYMLKLFVWCENALYNLRNDLKGVTSMEYGIIAATTVVVVGGVVSGLGAPLTTIWTNIQTALTAAAG
jgi:pilus assembly protein Flp/PilA